MLGGSIPENRPVGHFYSPTVSRPRLGIIQNEVFGTVCVNRRRELTSELPHSGFRQSGFGKEMSGESVLDDAVSKHMLLKHSRD